MDAWSNIECPSQEQEIIEIDQLGNTLGKLSPQVNQIRELITRFEACHFKYQQHLSYIKASILTLKPVVDPVRIGLNHPQKGEKAWQNDKTGRSLSGQQYLWAMTNWLSNHPQIKKPDNYNNELGNEVKKWLGKKDPEKERLVRLLAARLTYDWKACEILQKSGESKEIEFQVLRMDICHYAYPKHLNLMLKAIGKMKPVGNFEGCGIYNSDIKVFIENEFSKLCNWLNSKIISSKGLNLNHDEMIRIWLIVCLAKTLKEQTGLTKPIPKLKGQ